MTFEKRNAECLHMMDALKILWGVLWKISCVVKCILQCKLPKEHSNYIKIFCLIGMKLIHPIYYSSDLLFIYMDIAHIWKYSTKVSIPCSFVCHWLNRKFGAWSHPKTDKMPQLFFSCYVCQYSSVNIMQSCTILCHCMCVYVCMCAHIDMLGCCAQNIQGETMQLQN